MDAFESSSFKHYVVRYVCVIVCSFSLLSFHHCTVLHLRITQFIQAFHY